MGQVNYNLSENSHYFYTGITFSILASILYAVGMILTKYTKEKYTELNSIYFNYGYGICYVSIAGPLTFFVEYDRISWKTTGIVFFNNRTVISNCQPLKIKQNIGTD